MDPNRFDGMIRGLSGQHSRRALVGGSLGATVLTAVGLGRAPVAADDVTAENCTPEGKRCGKGKRQRPCKKCCTKNVITDQNGKRRCSCVRLGNDCSNDSQCCEGVCDSGTCQVTVPACLPLESACVDGDICCVGTCLDGTCGLLPACVPLSNPCNDGVDVCCAGSCIVGFCTPG
jgi:hypothetical protein